MMDDYLMSAKHREKNRITLKRRLNLLFHRTTSFGSTVCTQKVEPQKIESSGNQNRLPQCIAHFFRIREYSLELGKSGGNSQK